MKILIAADMEGISGVVNWDQVTAGQPEYTRFRRIMTEEINAAIRGAFEAGATEVLVTDGHSRANNILLEELDRRARLNSGSPSPFSMVQGVNAGVKGAFFVGYHARAGSKNAILDHTWSSECVANVWLNELLVGETGINAALCGHFGVPVIMVSGDQTVCAEAIDFLGAVEVAVVKEASGRFSATCLPLHASQDKVCEAAARAVHKLVNGQAPEPLKLAEPVEVRIEFLHSEMADRASLLPGAQRINGKQVAISAKDMPGAHLSFRAAVGLAHG